MATTHIALDIQNKEIFVAVANKKKCATGIETFVIPLAEVVLNQGMISNEPVLQSALQSVMNQFGNMLAYHVLLSEELTLIKSVNVPAGVKAIEYPTLVDGLLPKLFSLPSTEIVFDYQINKNILTIIVAQKAIIASWQHFFDKQKLKLITIGAKKVFFSKSDDKYYVVKQFITHYKRTFNLCPWRKQFIAFHFRITICLLSFYFLIVVIILNNAYVDNNKKQHDMLEQLQQFIDIEQNKKNELLDIGKLHDQVNKINASAMQQKNIIDHNSRVLHLFSIIPSVLPVDLFLNEITYRKSVLILTGESANYWMLRTMITTLLDDPYIKNCHITQLRYDTNCLAFELIIELKGGV